ncbi:MAG TPA: integrase repeat-containing protein [Candidatus Paceibacterota bacterium]
MEIVPREYQKNAVNLAVKTLKETSRALVVLATGLGKTITSALIAKKRKARQILFLAHNNFILDNSVREYRKVFGDKPGFATYNGLSRDSVKDANIVFASFQSMGIYLKDWRQDHFDLMVVDESHHSQAPTYRPVVEYFKCPRIGITATPNRSDLLDIRELFGHEVIDVTLEEAIAKGWLPRIEYHLVTDDGFDEKELQKIAKEVLVDHRRISLDELNRRVFVRARDQKIADIIHGYDEKTVVFCRNIPHANNFCQFLRLADTFHSKKGKYQADTWKKNRAVLENLRNGLLLRVLAVNAFNEGVDVPTLGLLVFLRVTDTENVFHQQLGRGCRPGKDKIIVLDFVGNVERVMMLRKMVETIRGHGGGSIDQNPLNLSGKGFEFTFSDQLVDLMKIARRITSDFYPTWQEASEATIRLGIKDGKEYREHRIYLKDPRLPSQPWSFYSDFPGNHIFFGKIGKYPTWQEARKAVIRLGIKNSSDHKKRYGKDGRLPASPSQLYQDFPGWRKFCGLVEIYPTWQEAGIAAKNLGIKSSSEYLGAGKRYKEDPRLPSQPRNFYSDFPGWTIFLGGEPRRQYRTWQMASKVARALKFKTSTEYKKRYKEDPLLPSSPHTTYKDFPGWVVFLGKRTRKSF